VLIDHDRVPVRVNGNKAAGPGRMFVCLIHQRYALGLQLALQIANVGEGAQLLCVAVSPRVESEGVLFEHHAMADLG